MSNVEQVITPDPSEDEEQDLSDVFIDRAQSVGKTPAEIFDEQRTQSEQAGLIPERRFDDTTEARRMSSSDVTIRQVEEGVPERTFDAIQAKKRNEKLAAELVAGEDVVDNRYSQNSESDRDDFRPAREAIVGRKDGSEGVFYDKYAGGGIVENGVLLYNPDGNPYYYEPRVDSVQERYALDREELFSLEDRLEARGYRINSDKDLDEVIAIFMEEGNAVGLSWLETLTQAELTSPLLADVPTAAQYTVTSSVDVKNIANSVAMQTIGRRFTSTELTQFVNDYNKAEGRFARQEQDPSVTQIEQPPSIEGAASEFAETIDPSRANAYKFLDKFQILQRLMTGGA